MESKGMIMTITREDVKNHLSYYGLGGALPLQHLDEITSTVNHFYELGRQDQQANAANIAEHFHCEEDHLHVCHECDGFGMHP
jgi:hypothetical protein